VLQWIRENGDATVLQEIPGTELLSRLWLADYDPFNQEAFNSFLFTLPRDEEAALTQVLHMAPPPGQLEEARQALSILSITRLDQHMQRLQTQLKQPGLTRDEEAEIQREVIELYKELKEAQKAVGNSMKTG
jgi:DNA primase